MMKVLVCDDEREIRLLYRTAFEMAGADVVVATDGDEGIAVAETQCPDLIVLDLRMPRRDGLAALPTLRERCPSARVLVVSAHYSVDSFSRARELGATECYDKLDFLGRIPALMGSPNAA